MSKMNKKLPALFLTLVLVLGMTACGGKTTDGTTGSTDNTVTAEEEDHKTQNTKVDPNSPNHRRNASQPCSRSGRRLHL